MVSWDRKLGGWVFNNYKILVRGYDKLTHLIFISPRTKYYGVAVYSTDIHKWIYNDMIKEEKQIFKKVLQDVITQYNLQRKQFGIMMIREELYEELKNLTEKI